MNQQDDPVKVSISLVQDVDGLPILKLELKFSWVKLIGMATKIKWASVAWQVQPKGKHETDDNELGRLP